MNAVKSDVEELVQKELESANQKFSTFHSDYEGAAIILEEIEEAKEALKYVENKFKCLWLYVKLDNEFSATMAEHIKEYAVDLSCEAIQVAAMAQQFIDSRKERFENASY